MLCEPLREPACRLLVDKQGDNTSMAERPEKEGSMDVIQKTQKKVTTFAFATVVAFAMTLAVGVVPAFAATVPWNSNVTVTAYADDPTYDITKASGSCSNIKVYMYDCDYLNANSLAVGDIYEPIWQD